ncbi:MAG: hypothetical protein IJS60_07735 [Abditibacteriota bacterium]|nr:hypothetical protein [Abditibacteriota bacterium]
MLGNIVVYSPVNYQVFQRTSKDEGFIEFSGCTKNVSALKAKITGKDLNGEKVDIETEIKRNVYGAFLEKVPVPSGGWYRVIITYTTDKGDSTYCASKVGVGEIIVAAGQSNSTNCGQYRTETETGMVSSTDGVFWQLGNDPQLGVHDKTPFGSIYPSLGDILYKEFKVPIGIASTGWGGTSSTQWQPYADILIDPNVNPKENLFFYFMKRVLWLGKEGFRCVIWHQGESDGDSEAGMYYQRMNCIIETSRQIAGWYIPWFMAKATFCPPNFFWQNVRDDQERLISDSVVYRGPDTDTLLGDNRDFDGEGIHFSPKGLKKHAEMWAEVLIPYIYSKIN